MAGKGKYKIYMLSSPEDIKDNEEHYLITPQYTLVYTKRSYPRDTAQRVQRISDLPKTAFDWLGECIKDIQRQYLRENAQTIIRNANEFGKVFKSALEAERKKEKGEKSIAEESEEPDRLSDNA